MPVPVAGRQAAAFSLPSMAAQTYADLHCHFKVTLLILILIPILILILILTLILILILIESSTQDPKDFLVPIATLDSIGLFHAQWGEKTFSCSLKAEMDAETKLKLKFKANLRGKGIGGNLTGEKESAAQLASIYRYKTYHNLLDFLHAVHIP